jgi:DNA-binding CsgD family transcriptional regulator
LVRGAGYGREMSLDPNATTTGMPTLRPIERRVVRLVNRGIGNVEIARRFRRSPEFIERVIEMTELPGRATRSSAPRADHDHRLRPVERCILGWIARGAGRDDIASRLHRSTNFVERVEDLARYKLATPMP